jgi:hypothetical protein
VHALARRDAVSRWFTTFIALHIAVYALHAANGAVPLRKSGCQSPPRVCPTQKISRMSACTGCTSSSAARA